MKNPVIRALPFLIACCLFTTARAATVDPVVFWNSVAGDAFGTAVAAGRPGQVGGLDLAMVHVAIHDTVQAFEGRFQPYHFHPIGAASGSVAGAVAKAAHDVLVNLYPAQTVALDTAFMNFLADNQIATNDPGLLVGQMAAADIIALRLNDGRFPPLDPRPCGPGIGVNCIFTGGTARLHALLRCGRRGGRRSRAAGHSFPLRRCGGAPAGLGHRQTDLQAFLPAFERRR